MGPIASQIADQLIEDRNIEIDFGTANPQGMLAEIRTRQRMMSYRKIWETLSDVSKQNIAPAIDLLARPHATPLEALMWRLSVMTGVELSRDLVFQNFSVSRLGTSKIHLSLDEKAQLKELFSEYLSRHGNDDGLIERYPTEIWFREFVLDLDVRIEQISKALKGAPPR